MARRRRGGSGPHDAAGGMRWLLTYSDLITLLMVFFVVMYAMSSADQKKFNALKSSLATALNTEGSNVIFEYQGTKPIEAETVQSLEATIQENAEFQEMARKIQGSVTDPKTVGFVIDERGLTIRFLDNLLFDLGQANLRPDAFVLLDAVGKELKGSSRYLRVEGHADNLPIHTVQYPSNWELSSARSIAVTRYLIEKHGMNPQHLSSLGYGEYRPLYPNNSDDNRSKNRRVDIVVLRAENSGAEHNGGR